VIANALPVAQCRTAAHLCATWLNAEYQASGREPVGNTGWALAFLGFGIAGALALSLVSIWFYRRQEWNHNLGALVEHRGAPAVVETPAVHVALDEGCKELADRSSAGTSVTLLWRPPTNELCLVVRTEWDGCELVFPIDHRDALDAFYHPFAYMPGPAVSERELASEPAL
jgi:hypothetical protein